MRTSMSYWKAMQLFLSDTGVHEVEINSPSLKLRCNCEGFNLRKSCKHVRFVKVKMDDNDGVYPTEISRKASKFLGNTSKCCAHISRNVFFTNVDTKILNRSLTLTSVFVS